jgi:multidrug efflux pump subunit AcrA (membrane-fusion protein)
MSITAVMLGLLLSATAQSPQISPNAVLLKNCLVQLDEEAEVPAQEAGVLQSLPVKEGQQVKKDQLLVQIDDTLAQMDLLVAANKLKVAEEEANNNINVDYAEADAKVTEAVYRKNLEANKEVSKSVPATELERYKLDWQRGMLSVVKAKMDKRIAGSQFKVSEAEFNQAREKLEHRRIKSPIDGQVRKIYRHVGEWVQPGDPVLHVVRVNLLRVEGWLNISKFAPEEVIGRPVTVKVELARGRTEVFTGNVVFVDPVVEAGGEYLVRAAVPNREENGQWLLRAGMNADMTIQLK